ncbi:SMP-30/gluconolactonase/LRE family protein [Flavivirga rizhaonensis]|uniref:SMP-30/gluconolactonase/LRE family protein n=1 Tax=Flavivirga rizhaonensis TaxID=2559571 RepID=A0A4S1DWT6_9FLAO|nr:SMP-30/gluconolactonase/LRE family protein [Flavivirga rizhaonensis]TGV02587.1 SMP-30/gluconolactonase/LRE family protein [Flavivirga rizhaonensis]
MNISINKALLLVFFTFTTILNGCKSSHDEKKQSSIEADSHEEKRLKEKSKVVIDSLNKYPSYGSIERLHPEIDSILSIYSRIDLVAKGFNWSEGPVWLAKEQKLLFSDVPENKVYQWNDLDGLSVYLTPSGYTGTKPKEGHVGSNGLALDGNGDLILCQHGDRAISRLISLSDSLGPKYEPLVTNYKGKRFNSPNDLMFDKKGNMYFTDPPYGLGKEKSDLGFNGVYFYSESSELILLDDELDYPNGLVVSNDGKILYVAESNIPKPIIWAYDIIKPGKVRNKRMFFDAKEVIQSSAAKQNPDGIKLDKNGNIFVAAGDGILIITPKGNHVGTINLGILTGNCEFTDDGKYLFITAQNYLLRVNLKPFAR